MPHPDEKIQNNAIDCVVSMENAIFRCGGSIELSRLLNMTIQQFITSVAAPNGVRFCTTDDLEIAGMSKQKPEIDPDEV